MKAEDLSKKLQQLISKANREGVVIEFETRDGEYFEVGTAEAYSDSEVILRA